MHALADWIAKLVQILYCITVDICIICSISLIKQTVIIEAKLYILADLFKHSSGLVFFLGGGGGVLQNPENPPVLATALFFF